MIPITRMPSGALKMAPGGVSVVRRGKLYSGSGKWRRRAGRGLGEWQIANGKWQMTNGHDGDKDAEKWIVPDPLEVNYKNYCRRCYNGISFDVGGLIWQTHMDMSEYQHWNKMKTDN